MTLQVRAPASKSISHRMLIAAALAPGHSVVRHVLDCVDLERTRAILTDAGARIEPLGAGDWRVEGMTEGPRGSLSANAPLSCDVHESGTTCRLLSAVLSAGRGYFRIHGVPRMHERPLGALIEALRSQGVDCRCEVREGYPPLRLCAAGLPGGDVRLRMDESSQYLSGMLLAAPFCRTPLRLSLTGEKAVSWPYVGLTLQTLEDFGLHVLVEERRSGGIWQSADWRKLASVRPADIRLTVQPGRYACGEHTVEGDWSGASYLLAAGAVGLHPLCVTGLRQNSLQGDRAIAEILRAMGAPVEWTPEGVRVSPAALHGVDVDMGDCPDLVPTVAALAAVAGGVTRIRNVAHLRFKESDRLRASAGELRRAGVTVDEFEDGLAVHGLGRQPTVPQGTVFQTHNDHRIAMSMALFGLGEQPVVVDNPSVVNKSFPRFWEVWSMLRCPVSN